MICCSQLADFNILVLTVIQSLSNGSSSLSLSSLHAFLVLVLDIETILINCASLSIVSVCHDPNLQYHCSAIMI